MRIKGRVSSGTGEGARYVLVYLEKIKKIAGFASFLGTLNIKTKKRVHIWPEAQISSFGKYGAAGLKCCKLNGVDCHIIIPEKARHTEPTIEIISKDNLRKKLKLRDSDEVVIEC